MVTRFFLPRAFFGVAVPGQPDPIAWAMAGGGKGGIPSASASSLPKLSDHGEAPLL